MLYVQSLIVFFGLAGAILVFRLLRNFGRLSYLEYFVAPMVTFCLGFILRLNSKQEIIDLGFFLTDISFLLVYTIFSIAILLGQIKYWKK